MKLIAFLLMYVHSSSQIRPLLVLEKKTSENWFSEYLCLDSHISVIMSCISFYRHFRRPHRTIVCVIELIGSACWTTQGALWIVTFLLGPCLRMFINSYEFVLTLIQLTKYILCCESALCQFFSLDFYCIIVLYMIHKQSPSIHKHKDTAIHCYCIQQFNIYMCRSWLHVCVYQTQKQ